MTNFSSLIKKNLHSLSYLHIFIHHHDCLLTNITLNFLVSWSCVLFSLVSVLFCFFWSIFFICSYDKKSPKDKNANGSIINPNWIPVFQDVLIPPTSLNDSKEIFHSCFKMNLYPLPNIVLLLSPLRLVCHWLVAQYRNIEFIPFFSVSITPSPYLLTKSLQPVTGKSSENSLPQHHFQNLPETVTLFFNLSNSEILLFFVLVLSHPQYHSTSNIFFTL